MMYGFNISATKFTKEAVQAVQQKGAKVLGSLGGESYSQQIVAALSPDGWMSELVRTLKQFVDYFGLDGVDLDVEFEDGEDPDTDLIVHFVREVRKTLGTSATIMYTIQTPRSENDNIVPKIARDIDFLNLMEVREVNGVVEADYSLTHGAFILLCPYSLPFCSTTTADCFTT